MIKTLAISLPQQYSKVDINWLSKLENDDGLTSKGELSKGMRSQLFKLASDEDTRIVSGDDDRYVLGTHSGIAKYKADKLTSVPDDKLYLNEDSVNYIEEKWLNGYKIPTTLYEDVAILNTVSNPGFAHYQTVRLDKLINYIVDVTDSREPMVRVKEIRDKISPKDWQNFFNK